MYSLLFLAILFTSCEKIYDFPAKGKYRKIPVIEALITNQQGQQRVRVSYSVPLNDSLSSEPIEEALVKIVDAKGDTAVFQYIANGWYTCDTFFASPDLEYSLLVKIDTVEYRATSMVVSVHGLDSVSYSFYKKENTEDSAYYLKIYAGPTDLNKVKYYQMHINLNHRLITSGSNILLSSDLATLSLNGIELDLGFSKNDTLDVVLYSLTREMFYYYVYIFNNILYNGNLDLELKTNPPIQFSPKALGYFQVSDLSWKSIVIR